MWHFMQVFVFHHNLENNKLHNRKGEKIRTAFPGRWLKWNICLMFLDLRFSFI
jgi:hypothetical protein